MTWYSLPNSAGAQGRIRTRLIQSVSGSITTSIQPQNEVTVPAQPGDLLALELVYTASLTGTVATAGTIDRVVQNIFMRDRNGLALINNIAGRFVYPVYERYLSRAPSLGRQRTINTVTGSAQTDRSILPINVENRHLDAKLTITVNNIAGLDTNVSPTATGGSYQVDVVAWYAERSALTYTQRLDFVSIPIVSGTNNLAPSLPQGVVIEHMFGNIGTESNITNWTLSRDGGTEFDLLRVTDLIGMENATLVDGHLTGYLDFNILPTLWTSAATFNLTGAGTDTLSVFLVKNLPSDAQ